MEIWISSQPSEKGFMHESVCSFKWRWVTKYPKPFYFEWLLQSLLILFFLRTLFSQLDPKEMRKNIEKLRMYNYTYTSEFVKYAGLPECDQVETGVIAQEVQEVLPDAVKETGKSWLVFCFSLSV